MTVNVKLDTSQTVIRLQYSSVLSFFFPWGCRCSSEVMRFKDELDMMRFLCKDFWLATFLKQIDNLRTNHQVSDKAYKKPATCMCFSSVLEIQNF